MDPNVKPDVLIYTLSEPYPNSSFTCKDKSQY